MRPSIPPNPWGDRRRRGRVGLLGGSFNPAHAGHLHVSREALRRLGLHEVWWLVSPQNPLKTRAGMAPLPDRLATARAVAAAERRIRVSDFERHLPTTYTIDTLRALRQRFPRVAFVWLMGADNLLQMPRWRAWEAVMACVPVAILDRAPYSGRALSGKAAQRFAAARVAPRRAAALVGRTPPAWAFLPIRRHGASATAIRAAGAAGLGPTIGE